MPRNFKEALLFTFLMCGMMVCGMSLWNLLILDWTGVVPFAWGHFFQGYIPGFVVAFLLDMLLVGPLAKTIAFAILHKVKAHDKRWALNFLVVGPISRFILGKLQKPLPGEEVVENFDDDDELPTII